MKKPSRHCKTWTKNELWELATLAQDKRKSWAQIAGKMKRTKSACIARFDMIRTAFLMYDPRFYNAESIMDIILRNKETK
ncbi:MAG: hypothetical protein WC179_07645 [Candidatus Cloacimonadaceae bacterium]|jgi:hypothetical protein